MPKVDGSFSTLDEPHDGQETDAPLPNISFSNFVRHLLQRYSKIGTERLQDEWYLNVRTVSSRVDDRSSPAARPGPTSGGDDRDGRLASWD